MSWSLYSIFIQYFCNKINPWTITAFQYFTNNFSKIWENLNSALKYIQEHAWFYEL